MTQHLAIAETYLAVWNEEDGERRQHLVNKAWTETARYVDPMMQGEGQQGIAAMIDAARQNFPGFRFVLTGTPDGHGVFTRFSWRLVSPAGEDVAGGTDVVSRDAEGRIENVVGFLDGAAA
ncbi:nuclear transport factor 2 family protein [Agrobacterium arsenijevicii]|uniref:Polyketide cyclase n=1 Tax=Agrobacterium arsenijevicii TaxID=1585697 RepID=A0ABR5D8M0_9HYPH|nr:polyketide cyclase [Agrobacterium arsenijevicii]